MAKAVCLFIFLETVLDAMVEKQDELLTWHHCYTLRPLGTRDMMDLKTVQARPLLTGQGSLESRSGNIVTPSCQLKPIDRAWQYTGTCRSRPMQASASGVGLLRCTGLKG